MRLLTLIGLIVIAFASVLPAAAQADGQFCVRAFEDRNANGLRDAGEPLLQSGISAELANQDGVIVGSALLENSPTAAQGVICFQGLEAGQYTIFVSSADYAPTTPNTMTATLRSGELPAVLEFGAGAVTSNTNIVEVVQPAPEAGLERMLWSLLAAILAALIMMVLGLIIYFLFVRRGGKPAPEVTPLDDVYRRPTDTGTVPRQK